jgi:hypothetical protein
MGHALPEEAQVLAVHRTRTGQTGAVSPGRSRNGARCYFNVDSNRRSYAGATSSGSCFASSKQGGSTLRFGRQFSDPNTRITGHANPRVISPVGRKHSGNGEHLKMDERDPLHPGPRRWRRFPNDPRFRSALKAHFRWRSPFSCARLLVTMREFGLARRIRRA